MTMCALDQNLADLDSRKALGRSHLDADRVEDAIQVYARLLRDYPGDIESYIFLGDCYLADGDANAALLLYSQALEHNPDNPKLHSRLRLACNKCVEHWNAHPGTGGAGLLPGGRVPTNPEAVANLLQELTSHTSPISEEQVVRAARLLEEIVNSAQPAKTVAERLDEINGLLPALLELNIRQARSDGREDLVAALRNLSDNIQIQKTCGEVLSKEQVRLPLDELNILFLNCQFDFGLPELINPCELLAGLGCQVTIWDGKPVDDISQINLIIARNPHTMPLALELLASAHAARVPLGLYLDADLEQMPVSHPGYEQVGLRSPGLAKAYTASLLLADRIIVPSDSFAENLRAAGYPAIVIPHGWSEKNGLWVKPARTRHTFNFGWVGAAGEIEDVFTIRRMIVRVMREFPHIQLVIGGDAAVYQLFDNLPESRRLYLPLVNVDDYPYILSQMDVLVLPFRNTSFNRTLSDRRIMDAGVRGIPWIASPIPAHMKWNVGGLFANTPDEWHTYLRQLVIDSDLRSLLGKAGRAQADLRRADFIQKSWQKLIEEMQDAEGG